MSHKKKLVPVRIPELRMTIMVHPDKKISDIRKKHFEHRDFERKSLPK